MKKKIKFSEAIKQSINELMLKDKNIILMGLGVGDAKNIFGTTAGLKEKFGNNRVFDVPCSENALTGIAIGFGIRKKVILTHQRFDFALLSFDQLINNAAKLHYMFGGNINTNITIRAIIGKGWGQGPTHSQNFQSLLAHIPGIKIFYPFSANDIYNILIKSVNDPNPVLILEHRWLYELKSTIKYVKKINPVKHLSSGKTATIVCMGETVLDAHKIKKNYQLKKIKFDIFQLISINPLNLGLIKKSLKKTKKLIILDPSNQTMSISSEIVARMKNENINFRSLVIANPDFPTPTSYFLTKKFYPQTNEIIKKINIFLKLNFKVYNETGKFHDIPDQDFIGPF